MRQAVSLSMGLLIGLGGCASPEVYDEVYPMDHRMSCVQLERTIEDLEHHRKAADESKGLTFRNVLTSTLFFPATMATYDNVDEARTASNKRQKHLMHLYVGKGCADETPASAGAQPVMMMPSMPPQAAYQRMGRLQPVGHAYSEIIEVAEATAEQPGLGTRYSPAHQHSAAYLFE